MWTQDHFTFEGELLQAQRRDLRAEAGAQAASGDLRRRRDREAAKTLISKLCDAYVMHGDPVDAITPKIADMEERRARAGKGRMQYGMAAFAIVRDSETEARRELERITQLPPTPPKGFDNFDQWLSGTQLERAAEASGIFRLEQRLAPNLVGTPEQIQERIAEYEAAGLHLLLLQMSPQAEEMDRFAAQVIAPMRRTLRSWSDGMKRRFDKMHGLGNDFVIIDARREPFDVTRITRARDRRSPHRRRLRPADRARAERTADLKMRIWNSDGGEVESCGNATRCVVQLTGASSIDTAGGCSREKIRRRG